ncbi:MAG: GNAT family N-acetyltransferase [Zetaproteobacteria bacterium CG12_big_fil_rev_8_21_14_0_65_54_13]|nr:MAG: GNAT family N-acetyltransferase [Zetaproteobacteria bacterium CG12_big_fil_rev_8_21_14_0_65_54_13]PIX53459.1 MAG: GNAT family N-acetyltransferase [Zetaproteobacteria bacterium CG_4_10_14_3_um_filter_54_28]PJA27696.1 MAG: GNAT family N-acetyltransferase [Zetaproteobacteria bacterium CG_4_9_14_3_um_filter_54_145]
MLNVDALTAKYLPGLHNKPPVLQKTMRMMLRILFHEKQLNRFQARYPHLEGFDFVEQLLEHFNFGYTLRGDERECIPSRGRVVIIANHPIGTLDAAILIRLVGEVRRDVKAISNQVLSGIQPLTPLLLPVDNMGGHSSREQLKSVYRHLEQEGAVIIFPAGEVSRMSPAGIRDGSWNSGFLRIATATRSPILPVYIDGRNSMFFYALSLLSRPLSTLWLVREMFKQARRSVHISIGNPVPFDSYQHTHLPLKSRVKLFQRHLYRIGKQKEPVFATSRAVAHPENRQQLRQEIHSCELLGETGDGKRIYLFAFNPDCTIMREIGRLRETSFRAVGEGTGQRRDVDPFDRHCRQIILWDEAEMEIVGAYRLRDTRNPDDSDLYTGTLFDFQPAMTPIMQQGLELGRSFVQPRYWGKRSLDYLWFGIGAFLRRNPDYRYLFGPVSISDSYPAAARDMLIYFYSHWFGGDTRAATARLPYHLSSTTMAEMQQTFPGVEYKRDYITLKSRMRHLGCTVPTLLKQYGELCEPGGVRFVDFNIDPDFCNCVDGLVVVDLQRLKAAKRKRYIDSDKGDEA